MKILAVIPARAGSKGVPNKNIRLINNRPLVYYAINNAKKSKYITDILVSTDSVDVEIIATQMGVGFHRRSAELCKDDTTLDSVIYDAMISTNKEWDYIVTMQPTSPTLLSETLDNAIEYSINNNLDTVISAINAPHLTWRLEGESKVPNYEKRLNRQFLPPCYSETGAFVVSKANIVTQNTRIGKKLDLYEISEAEAIDVDNFCDLHAVGHILAHRKIAFYVNGNNTRGTGHIYRALELADEFYTRPDIYYDINQTDPKVFGSTTHELIGINGIGELFERCKKEQYNVFINDILTTSIDYMIALKEIMPNAKIINFEDDGEGIHKADLIINALYDDNNLSNCYSGEKYFIANKLFMFYEQIEIKDDVKNVFVSFGGADPQNYTDLLLEIIKDEQYNKYKFTVVLGRAKSNIDDLMKYNEYENITVLHDIRNMPQIMSECDIGITSRGRTGYELAMLGVPTIVMAQNQREENHGFVSDANGFIYLGLSPKKHIINASLQMLINMPKEERQEIQKTLLSHDLRGGRSRVMDLINSL